MHDVYAYGVIAPSTLYELSDDFPPASGYAEIADRHWSIGGEAAAGAYVLARLGVSTKLDGNRIGSDDVSARALEILETAGVDCSSIAVEPGSGPVTELVVTAGETRTVFGTYRQLSDARAWNQPSEPDVRSSRIVCVDPFFGNESIQVARWCVDADKPYVTVDAGPDSEMARYAEAVIVSEEFAVREIEAADPLEIMAGYTAQCRGLVILTLGSRPILYARPGEQPKQFLPFPVEARDTTGAGDSFRSGIIFGMLRGYNDERLIRTASAVAALVCQQVPGVLNSPSEQEVEQFLGQRL